MEVSNRVAYVLGDVVLDLFAVADGHEEGGGLVAVQSAVAFDLEERVHEAKERKVSSESPEAAKVVTPHFGLDAVALQISGASVHPSRSNDPGRTYLANRSRRWALSAM